MDDFFLHNSCPTATDPTRLSLVEKEGTSVPRPLFTVQAEDDDADDVITFTRTGSDVS